ncbi:hypothetical protein BV898_14675 [Hypsibius exemplaris]|uniref:Uncharacterized protein n=1 Tax=Hypsibius exemplaris TaxID=2072580 RepID=A0A9X6RJS1_HYPEX|nr:hypothetical protein BV898_14675 [Hypsibius exemplaris]
MKHLRPLLLLLLHGLILLHHVLITEGIPLTAANPKFGTSITSKTTQSTTKAVETTASTLRANGTSTPPEIFSKRITVTKPSQPTGKPIALTTMTTRKPVPTKPTEKKPVISTMKSTTVASTRDPRPVLSVDVLEKSGDLVRHPTLKRRATTRRRVTTRIPTRKTTRQRVVVYNHEPSAVVPEIRPFDGTNCGEFRGDGCGDTMEGSTKVSDAPTTSAETTTTTDATTMTTVESTPKQKTTTTAEITPEPPLEPGAEPSTPSTVASTKVKPQKMNSSTVKSSDYSSTDPCASANELARFSTTAATTLAEILSDCEEVVQALTERPSTRRTHTSTTHRRSTAQILSDPEEAVAPIQPHTTTTRSTTRRIHTTTIQILSDYEDVEPMAPAGRSIPRDTGSHGPTTRRRRTRTSMTSKRGSDKMAAGIARLMKNKTAAERAKALKRLNFLNSLTDEEVKEILLNPT